MIYTQYSYYIYYTLFLSIIMADAIKKHQASVDYSISQHPRIVVVSSVYSPPLVKVYNNEIAALK